MGGGLDGGAKQEDGEGGSEGDICQRGINLFIKLQLAGSGVSRKSAKSGAGIIYYSLLFCMFQISDNWQVPALFIKYWSVG